RRHGKLSPNLGVFVFLLPKGPGAEHGDHSMVSGVVYLPRLREKELARDAFTVAIPERARGSWQVRVGFWNEHGDHKRRKVHSSMGAPVIEDAVVLGSFDLAQ